MLADLNWWADQIMEGRRETARKLGAEKPNLMVMRKT
jgi:hypothetical protein